MPRKKAIEPRYISGKQAGFNPKSGRWTGLDGKMTSKARAIESNIKSDFSGKDDFGGRVEIPLWNNTPISNEFGRFEVISSPLNAEVDEKTPYNGLQNVLKAALQLATDPDKKRPANYMLPQVQTRMRLAEHFYQTEGDATNVCDVPIELISRKLIVHCPDTELREDIEGFLADNGIEEVVSELWRTMRVYGQAFPHEAWDETDKNKVTILNLYPLHVHVGYNWGFALGSEYVGENAWSKELIETRMPPALHRPLLRHWNENPPPYDGAGMPLDGTMLRPIRDRDFNWTRYSMPMLSRGFRDLTSRIVHEDAIRAVTEGYKYQLWVFSLGDADHMPLPAQLNALRNNLSGINVNRTGMLVWWNAPLNVNVYAPTGLDTLMGGNYLSYLTKQFFRKMGITAEVVSGEMPGILGGTGGRGGAGDLDVMIYIERARYQADQVTRWVEYLVKKWANRTFRAKKPLAKLRIQFAPNILEMEKRVEKVFMPMYEGGALSLRTLQSAAGLTYESELSNKEEESKKKDLWVPPATFSQTVVGPEGDVTKEVSQTQPKGSPTKLGEQRNRMGKKPAKKVTVEAVDEGDE